MKFSIVTVTAFSALVSAAPTAPSATATPTDPDQPDASALPIYEEPEAANLTLSILGTDAPFGIKKGLAYNNGGITGLFSRPGSATWAYNWGAAQNAPKFQQIPMCWGLRGDCDANGINAKISAGDTPWVLGYNEPDVDRGHGGCNASPRQAYDAWGSDMFRFANRGVKLVCPAISSWDTNNGHTGGPSGLTWLRQFASIGNNPAQFRCDAQALHWYGENGKSGRDQAALFISYVERAHRTVNEIFRREMDLWITEFAPLPVQNPQIMADFLDVAIPWLDRTGYVARYSPFMAEHMVSGSSLNVAGLMFVNRKG